MTPPRSRRAASPRLLLLVAPGTARKTVGQALDRLTSAGISTLVVTLRRLPARVAERADHTHALAPAAQEHGPAFRRALHAADPSALLLLYVKADHYLDQEFVDTDAVVTLGDSAGPAAQWLVRRHHVPLLNGVDEAMQRHDSLFVNHRHRLAYARTLTRRGLQSAQPWIEKAVQRVISNRLLSQRRRYRLASGTARGSLRVDRTTEAERLVRAVLPHLDSPRLRADLLGDVTSLALAHGQQPTFAQEAYAAELVEADRHYAQHEHDAAAQAFDEAMRIAFHRAQHMDAVRSPLAADPAGFSAPLRSSNIARALQSSRDPARADHTPRRDRPLRVLFAVRDEANDKFLGEIRDHFASLPDFDCRFLRFAESDETKPLLTIPPSLVRRRLAGESHPPEAPAAEARLRWADAIFVEWCETLAAVVSQLDLPRTRVIVRMHSYEVFTKWPHLVDFGRVDDVVFVSEHLRDLAVAAVPALQGPDAPRLHVIANAVDLRRCVAAKPEAARFTLGVVGASKVVKDPRWAVEVLRRVRRHDPRYRLLLIRGHLERDHTAASRQYAEALDRDIAEQADAVTVLDHTDDVPGVLTNVGVVLSSSVRESFHIGLLEGAASGAVPVVRDWPFFPGSAYRLFPESWVVADPEQACERILAVTGSAQTWHQAGCEAAEHALARWDWDVVSQDFESLLRS